MKNFMETRGMLAKLLATENLVVQHVKGAETASFNTENRVLTLPILNTINEHVYNLFVSHEVGHALWTPVNWVDQVPNDIPFDFVNVIEDVRIERAIQNKFPGLRRDFTKGYDELDDKDFFGIVDKDLSKLSFIDRINIHFKLGARALVPFSEEEMTYVRAVDEADTFDKVCLTAAMLRDYLNAKREEKSEDNETSSSSSGSGQQDGQGETNSTEGEGEDQTGNNKSSGMNSDGEGDDKQESPEGSTTAGGGRVSEMTAETQHQFDSQMEDLAKPTGYGAEVVYIRNIKPDLSDLITSVDVLRESFSNSDDHDIRIEFKKFLTSIKRDVNFMVQQFEMKKSADAYARQQIHKTGVLNTGVLHNYKLTDDLFLRQTVTPDGKNHGMMMLIDWSGSMSTHIVAVVKQLITLVQFCRKVQIPFEVYTFTSGRRDRGDVLFPENVLCFSDVQMVQAVSSTSKARDIDTDLFHLYSQAICLSSYRTVPHSDHLAMGGTPLNNSMFVIPELVRRFRDRTKAQKVSFCVLTDGESSPLVYWERRQSRGYDGQVEICSRPCYAYYKQMMLRDGYDVVDLGNNEDDITGRIAAHLQDTIEDFSIFNIFVGTPKNCENHIRRCTGSIQNFDSKVFRKENALAVASKGWPLICVISPKAFGDADDEIKVESGESKAKIRTALKKFLASKQSSKNLLTRIVSSFA